MKRTLENSKDYQTNLINIFEPKILNLVPPAELSLSGQNNSTNNIKPDYNKLIYLEEYFPHFHSFPHL